MTSRPTLDTNIEYYENTIMELNLIILNLTERIEALEKDA